MNHFNRYYQRPESNIIDFATKLTAFTRKLNLWIKNIENRQFGMFENVKSLGGELSIAFVQETTKHHLLLKDEIKHYFCNDGDAQAYTYTGNTFTAKPDGIPVGTGEQEELIDLQCDEAAQQKFKDFTLANFQLNISSSPTLPKYANNYSASCICNNMKMRTWVFCFCYSQVKIKKLLGKHRARFSMFCEQNISTACKISRRKASAAIALTCKYLLVDKLYIWFFMSM